MSKPEVRGNCISAVVAYVESTYDAERAGAVLGSLPPGVVEAMRTARDKEFYPASHFSDGLRAVAEAAPDLAEARAEVVNVGAHIANASIASFMRLIMKMMTPRLFFHKLPEFFAKDFRNTSAKLLADVSDIQSRRVTVIAQSFAEHPYVACAAVGWVRTGLTGIGCHGITVEGPADAWDLQDDQFVVRWEG